MNCQEFQTSLYSYVHGELGVKEIMAADAHSAECLRCQSLVDWERWFRQLLRHQLWGISATSAAGPDRFPHSSFRQGRRSPQWLITPLAAIAVLIVMSVLPSAKRSVPGHTSLLVDHGGSEP